MTLRSDHSPEFFSIALFNWATDKELRGLLIEPAELWQTGTNKSFNEKSRDECLEVN
jgi:hypothetical protein